MKTKIVHRKLNCLFWKKVHVCHNMERCHTQLYNWSVLMSQYGLVQSVIIHLDTTGTGSCFSWYCEILHLKPICIYYWSHSELNNIWRSLHWSIKIWVTGHDKIWQLGHEVYIKSITKLKTGQKFWEIWKKTFIKWYKL